MTLSHAAALPSSPASALGELQSYLASRRGLDAEAMPFAEYEARLHLLVQAVEREALAEELGRLDSVVAVVRVDGAPHRLVLRSSATYMTTAGEVTIERSLYAPGARGERTVCPMELRAGIVEGWWTPGAASQAIWLIAHLTPGEAEEALERLGGMRPSRCSLDRLPKAVNERWEAERVSIQEELIAAAEVPERAVSAAVSLDGVLTPMRDGNRASKREASRKAGKEVRGPAGYQEVGCGSVSFYNADGERLSTVRLGRMPESGKATLKELLRLEVEAILQRRPDLVMVRVADGARDNWTFLSKLVGGGPEVLDFFHAAEHLSAALGDVFGEGTAKAKEWFERHRTTLLGSTTGIDIVLRSLVYLRGRNPNSKPLARTIKFFRRNRRRMAYADLKARNLPIGSGVIEATCKTLVSQRLKRSGMRWRHDGGQAILSFRAAAQSGRFDQVWNRLAATYRKGVQDASNVVALRRVALSG